MKPDTCPMAPLLEARRDGRLGAREEASLARHVAACADCQALECKLDDVRRLLRLPAGPALTPLQHQRGRLALLRAAAAPPPPAPPLSTGARLLGATAIPAVAALACIAAVMTMGGSVTMGGPRPPQTPREISTAVSVSTTLPDGALSTAMPVSRALSDGASPTATPAPATPPAGALPDGALAAATPVPATLPATTRPASVSPSSEPSSSSGWARRGRRTIEGEGGWRARSSPSRPPQPDADEAASKAFGDAVDTLGRGDYAAARERLDAFRAAHPADARADLAAFLTIVSLQHAGRRAEAQEAARRYLDLYPGGDRRGEALRVAEGR